MKIKKLSRNITNVIIAFFFMLGSVVYWNKLIVPMTSNFGMIGTLIDLIYCVIVIGYVFGLCWVIKW